MKAVYPDRQDTRFAGAPAGCGAKVRYETPGAAVRALERVKSVMGLRGQAHSYRCGHCGGYHWGHKRA